MYITAFFYKKLILERLTSKENTEKIKELMEFPTFFANVMPLLCHYYRSREKGFCKLVDFH